MKTEFSKKTKVSVLLIIYLVARLYQSWEAAFRSDVFADITKTDTNIVAVFVDKDLYSNTNLKNSLERYTTQYIQWQISNSKAVVFPLDTTVVKSWDIAKLLENLYYDGIEKEPSTLEWVILIGDKIPLPVVNDNGAIFPTILPYTDFDDPKFYRDAKIQYFLPNGVAKAQPEVRHSVINLESNVSDYVVYFQKLKSYYQNPSSYVGDRVWYEDFIDQKGSYNDLNLVSYMNKFLFAEDLAYHRYNPLLIDFLNQKESQKKDELMGWLANLTGESWSYASQVWAVFSGLMADYLATDTSSADQIPTVFVDDALQGFQKSYSDLYGVTSTARMRDNILAGGRRDTTQIDTHSTKIEYFDQLYTKQLWQASVPLLAEVNKQFEDALTTAVRNNDYALRIAIPQDAQIQKHIITKTWDVDNAISDAQLAQLAQLVNGSYYHAWIYEAFYYGKNASTVTGIDQTSIFLWSDNILDYSLDNLTTLTWYKSNASIGVSQGIFSQFVEANRWYVTSLTQPDLDKKTNNDICGNDMDNFVQYRDGFLWWNTPLNLTWWTNGLELVNKRYDRGGKSNWLVTNSWLFGSSVWLLPQAGEILDVAWSRRVANPLDWMVAANLQWWYLQRVAYRDVTYIPLLWWTWSASWKQVNPCDLNNLNSEPLQNHNIYNAALLNQTWYQKILKINNTTLLTTSQACPANPSVWSACFPVSNKRSIPAGQFVQKQEVNYKLIDSLSIHNAPNSEQVSQLETTTPSRPIDSVRYIAFKGIGWDQVQLPYPNLYEIAVYKQDTQNPNRLILKTPDEIKTAIRDYLSSLIELYNARLTEQLNKKDTYYNSNASLFTTLGAIDSLASPNRSYTLLQPSLFNGMVSDEFIDSLAQILYVQNSFVPQKQKTSNLKEEYDQYYTIANISNKKEIIIKNYLTQQNPSSLLALPWYQSNGYELISLVSDGDDSIATQEQPSWLLELQSQITEYQNYQNVINTRGDTAWWDESIPTDACSAPYGEPVPLIDLSNMSFPWFKVFACWLENIGVPKVTFDFNNAQWPVFTSDFFKWFLSQATPNIGWIAESYTLSAPTSSLAMTSEEQALVNNLDLSLSTQTYSLQDNVPLDLKPSLLLTQKQDIQNLTLRISSTGDSCIIIDGKNTCTTSFQSTITEKNYISPYLIPSQPKAWATTLIVQICRWSVCSRQTLPFLITPWSLHSAELSLPSTRILSKSQIPVQVVAKDKYNNVLSTSLSPLKIRTSTGSFQWWSTEFSLTTFRDVGQLIAPSSTQQEEIDLTLYDKNSTLLANKKLSVLSGSLLVASSNSYYNSSNNSLTYTLPNKKSQIYLPNNNVNVGLLPQLSLKLQWSDGKSIAWPVIVSSEQWLFSVYEKSTSTSSAIIPSTGLQQTNTLIFNGTDNIDIVLQPKLNNNIGSDTLLFQYPDGSVSRIPVTIRPAQQAAIVTVQSNTTQWLLDNEVTVPLVIQLIDDWGNISPYNQTLQVSTVGSVSLQWPTTVTTVWWTAQIIVKSDNLWWPWYVKVSPTGSWSIIPWLWTTKVKKSIIPTSNINGLYLNLMGTSRWNTTDSETDYYNTVPNMLKTSKVLATTTELISPQTVPTTVLTINPDGSLSGSQADQWIITSSGTIIIAQNPDLRQQVTLWSINERSRSSNLVTTTESYPEQFSLYPKLLRSQWSTNSEKLLTLVDSTLVYDPNKLDSIEESVAPSNNIAWRNNQQHLVQFSQWKTVGEATLLNASEFLINYGDPLITRTQRNETLTWSTMDAWPWQLVVSNTTKTVLKAFSLDVNNDSLEDIVTVFTDGSVIWSKQYGGKDSIFVEMWPLLQIYGTIKAVYGADTQWDGFGDIIVQTEEDDLRVYTNELGIFNVDGYPLCIDAEQDQQLPQRMTNVDQWFVEDMDNDGTSDIVLNKAGEISIVYGGKASNGYSYISQNQHGCDVNWQTRQNNNKKIVDYLWVQLHTGSTVDSSLVRWKWLTTSPATDTDGNEIDTTSDNPLISSQIGTTFSPGNSSPLWVPNISTFPVEDIVNQASSNLLRRSVSPIDFSPSYETLSLDDIRYISASALENSDQIRVNKTYQDLNWGILKKWDSVKVTVQISWLRNDPLTYIERINGPWNITMQNNIISWWNAWTLPSSATYNSIEPQGDFYFVVDNITLWASNAVEFSYNLVFQWWAPVKISVSDRNHDDYKDISVYPLDSCSKFLRTYTNTKSLLQSYRIYQKEFIDIWSQLENYHTAVTQWSQNFLSGMVNSIANITGSSQIQDILNGASSENMSFGNFFNQVVGNGWYSSFNLNVSLMGEFDAQVSESIQNTLDSICSWGWAQDQSCNSWLPVPFNMAFLSPGTYNIMWCTPKVPQIDNVFPKDGWFPIFAFPANFPLTTPAWVYNLPLPFPWWWFFKWETDSYWYFGFPSQALVKPAYSSQIRIYLSPTLTQQMGMAICFGPQTVGKKIPDPFSSIGWNCIVTKVKMPSGTCNIWDGENSWWLSDQDMLDLAEFGQCTQTKSHGSATQPASTQPSSPFTMVSINSQWSTSNPFPPWTYFGIINFEKTPVLLSDMNVTQGVILQWGKAVQPQIQGWWARGMVACIMNDWLDRQTNYIINNLTNMQIGVYLPDLSQLWQWFDTLWQQIGNADFFTGLNIQAWGQANNPNTFSWNFISQVRNSTISQSQTNNLSTTINNPFKTIEKLFEQTPLINITTQDVAVNVPMIYSEDITRYEAHLKSWIERNKQVATDRTTLLQWVFGICWRNYQLWWWNAPYTLWNNPFDPAQMTALKNQLQATRTNMTSIVEQAQECKNNWWKKEWTCADFMSLYDIGSTNEWDQTLLYMENTMNINSACLNIVWWDLNTSIANIMTITSQTDAFENRIRENIKVLDQYKRFPLQLYEWIHVTDRYLWEVTSMVENFLWYINTWLNLNATRFEQYVDAIITISTSLQTWQAILDLSVNRQQKCSTCTVDSYDAYACSLWFLCGQLKLPILRLPPFKIPNIYIDLTHIDLGMDILLPNFQFVPTSVPLIEIPDLPQPPSIVVWGDIMNGNGWLQAQLKQIEDIQKVLDKFTQLVPTQIPLSVPTIPLLPAPPTLPELPSFVPNINIELPVLPPAPKLPRIAPEIETAINVVSFFSDLYCIVKWWIGLVGENNVKTRIEQLTQRTREIPLFDNINLTKDMSYQQDKLVWFDFKIDAFVNFTMNFTAVYDLIQGLADQINDQTRKLTDWNPNQAIGTDKLQEYANKLNDQTQKNIDLTNPFGYSSQDDDSLIALTEEQQNIKQVNEYMMSLPQTPQEKKWMLQELVARVNTPSEFKPQIERLTQVQHDVVESLYNSRTNLKLLSSKIEDYDTFIDSLDSNTTYSVYEGDSVYTASLFDNTAQIELPKESLVSDYVSLQKKLLSNYDKGLYQVATEDNKTDVTNIRDEITYLDKWLSLAETLYTDKPSSLQTISYLQREYNSLGSLEYNNQAAMCSTLGNMTNPANELLASSTPWIIPNTYPNILLSAQLWSSSTASSSSYNSTNLYDFASYKNKLMVPFQNGTGTRYVDVVQSDYFSQRNKWYQLTELNSDGKQDVIRRDQSQVWIKYGEQNTAHTSTTLHTHTNKYYVAPIWDDSNEWEERTNKNGYMKINGTSFKLYSPDWSVKNLRVRSQDYDSFTISWTNSTRQQPVDGYVLELNMLPDTYHLKAHEDLPKALQSRYVLLLPQDQFTTWWYLSIYNQLSSKKMENLMPDTLIDVVPYNVEAGQISYTFTDIERAWYYTRIASVVSNDSKKPVYSLNSPWSHHVVAWQQLIADNDGPTPEVRLIREQNSDVVDTWLNPQWIVNTRYRLDIQRDDPSGILSNQIMNASWDILSNQSGASNNLSGLYFVANQSIQYRIHAQDGMNNESSETVVVNITIPSIQIEDIIEDNMIPWWLNILASVSRGMDDGIVKFERKRNNIRSTLSNPNSLSGIANPFSYSLWFDQTIVTWGVYNQTNGIELFASNGTSVATVDKENGQITIAPAYVSRIQLRSDFSSQVPAILLYDVQENRTLFTIKPKMNNTSFQVFPPYTLQSLTWVAYGSYSGWSCIKNTSDDCVVVMNSAWSVVVPSPYHTSLVGSSYSFTNGVTTMGLSTAWWIPIGSLSFTAILP